MSYLIPKKPARAEFEIKKSRFIAYANYAADRVTALEFLEELKLKYPDARHHCWAYVLGNSLSAAMGDDGEPSGTAGKPILNILQHKNLGDVMLVVVRYFGGIKLGAGGLTRAYSQAAQMVVDELETIEFQPKLRVEMVLDFALEQPVRHQLDQINGRVVDVEYSTSVLVTAELLEENLPELEAFIQANSIKISVIDA